MARKRAPRFARREVPVPATVEALEGLPGEITQLLSDLYAVHYLMVDDVALLHYPKKGVNHVQRWLRRWYDRGYLDRIPTPVGQPMVYVMGKNGLRYIAHATGLRSDEFRHRYRDSETGTATLPHNLEVNHLWAMLKHATLRPARPIAELGCYLTERAGNIRHLVTGAELMDWMPESELYLPSESHGKRAARVADPFRAGRWLRWLPDAHLRLRVAVEGGSASKAYVLEHERSRRSLARFVDKARALVAYNLARDNAYGARFGEPIFYRVAVTTNTWKEALTFGHLLAEAHLSPGKFLFCRYRDLTPDTILEKHWLRAADLPPIDPRATEAELETLLISSDLAKLRMSLLDDQPVS